MATIGYADLPVPGGGDGPLGPAALAALATALDPRLVHRVGDQADRDEEFADAPPGTLVIAADGTAWWRAASTWVTLYEPVPAWRGITLKAGYEQNAVNLGVRRTQGTFVSLKGRVNATSGNINSPDAAINIGSVPATASDGAARLRGDLLPGRRDDARRRAPGSPRRQHLQLQRRGGRHPPVVPGPRRHPLDGHLRLLLDGLTHAAVHLRGQPRRSAHRPGRERHPRLPADCAGGRTGQQVTALYEADGTTPIAQLRTNPRAAPSPARSAPSRPTA